MPRTLLLRSVLMALICAAPFAVLAAEELKQLNVPAGDLTAALESLVKQSGVELVYQGEQLKGLKTQGVKGKFTTGEAVSKLLEGTPLILKADSSGAMLIMRAPPSVTKTTASSSLADKAREMQVAQAEASAEVAERSSKKPGSAPGEAGGADVERPVQEITVTAQKREERLHDVPQSISVLSSNDLDRLGVTQFRDFANTVPGLSFSTQGAGYTQVSLRGVTVGVDLGPTVGVYVDEIAYGGSTVFSAGAQLALDVGLFDLDRVEVLRGPQGTLYGASTMGGLLKYVSRLPDLEESGARIRAGISSTQHGGTNHEVAGSLNLPVASGIAALRLSGFQSFDGGFIDNIQTNDNDANQAYIRGGRVDFLLEPTEPLSIRLTAFLQDIDRHGDATVDYNYDGSPVDGELDQRRAFEEPFDQRFWVASGTVSYDFGSATLTSVSSYQSTNSVYSFDLSGLYAPLLSLFGGPYSAVALRNDAVTDKFTQEVRLASQGDNVLDWVAGAYYTKEDSTYRADFLLRDTLGVPSPNLFLATRNPSIYEEAAFFGDLTWHFNKRFDATVGLRYSNNDQRSSQAGAGFFASSSPRETASEDVVTYLANLRYHIDDRSLIYLRYATGYRPGGPNFNFLDPATGAPIGPGSFRSDSLRSYEAGFRFSNAQGTLALDSSVYVIDWSDIQVSIIRGGFSGRTNAPSGASIRGAELALTARPTRDLRLAAALAFQDAQMDSANADIGAANGEHLPNVPEWTAALTADWQLPIGPAFRPVLGATFRYVDKRMASFNNSTSYLQYPLPAYSSADLRLGFSLRNVSTQIYVHNLTDERGELSAMNYRGPAQPALMQPRTLGVSVSVDF